MFLKWLIQHNQNLSELNTVYKYSLQILLQGEDLGWYLLRLKSRLCEPPCDQGVSLVTICYFVSNKQALPPASFWGLNGKPLQWACIFSEALKFDLSLSCDSTIQNMEQISKFLSEIHLLAFLSASCLWVAGTWKAGFLWRVEQHRWLLKWIWNDE